MAQEEMEVDFETVPYPLGLPRIYSDSVLTSHSVELVPNASVDYSNSEHDNVIVLDSVLVRPENVVAGVRLLSEAIQQIGERSILRVQQQPPERRNTRRQQRAARPSRLLVRSHAPLDSYFQVSRQQTAAVAPPTEYVRLPEVDEGDSSDATVLLSDSDDGDSAAEEIEQALAAVPNVGGPESAVQSALQEDIEDS